jgi:hypothetical protein
MLIEAGEKMATSRAGSSSMIAAHSSSCSSCFPRPLSASGYDVNYQSEVDGETALFFHARRAAEIDHVEEVWKILLDHGAARSYRSHLDRIPAEIRPTGYLAKFIAEYDAKRR